MMIKIIGMALLFAQAVLTARLLGPAGYGTVSIILATAQILSVIATLGFGSLSIREVAARTKTGDLAALTSFLRLALITVTVCATLMAMVGAVVVFPAMGKLSISPLSQALGAMLVVPFALLALFRGLAQGFSRIVISQIPSDLLRPGIIVIALAGTAFLGRRFSPQEYLLVALVAAMTAGILAIVWLWWLELRKLPMATANHGRRKSMTSAAFFLGVGLAAILQGEINTLLLAALSGPRETGLFQPVIRLAPLLALPIQAASMRYSPRMAELWEKGDYASISSISRIFAVTTTILTFVLAMAIGVAGPRLMLVFGPEFLVSAPLLWIVGAGMLFIAMCGPASGLLSMCGRPKESLAGYAVGLTTNAATGLVLIPKIGASGAAISMSVGLAIWSLTTFWLAKTRLNINTSVLPISNRPHLEGVDP